LDQLPALPSVIAIGVYLIIRGQEVAGAGSDPTAQIAKGHEPLSSGAITQAEIDPSGSAEHEHGHVVVGTVVLSGREDVRQQLVGAGS
jgi:hypothetical protein